MTRRPAQPSRHPLPPGSALIRQLATFIDTGVPPSKDAFAQRLSRWFDWTDAIALSAALNGAAEEGTDLPLAPTAEEREVRRVRVALAQLADPPPAAPPAGRSRPAASATIRAPEATADFPSLRRRYVAAQQAMAAQIAPLRRRLRATLQGRSPALARLAALDAVMEQVVGEREYVLLASVPRWLEAHHERLRRDQDETPAESDAAADRGPSAHWPNQFSQDMRAVLLAELDLRLQPVEGLLEALRRSSPDSP